MQIRTEQEQDHPFVFTLIKKAFEGEEFTDHKEQYLVERLRKSAAFIPELSLVALADEKIVGYVLLTEISIIPVAANPSKTFGFSTAGCRSSLPKERDRRRINQGSASNS